MPHERSPDVSQSNRYEKWWLALKIFCALALFIFVLAKIRTEDVAALARQLSPAWLLGCLVAYIASTWFIAKRYHDIIGQGIPFDQIFGVVAGQIIISSIFANVAGFTYYLAMLRGKHQVGLGNGIWSLVAARFFDLLIWLPFFALASWVAWPQVGPIRLVVVSALALMAAIIIIIALALAFHDKFLTIFKKFLIILTLDKFALIQKIMASLDALVHGDLLKNLCSLLIYSFMILVSYCAFLYSTLKLFGVSLDKGPLVFIVIITQVLILLPFNVFGGLGWVDISQLYLYGLFGLEEQIIAPVIVGGRIVSYGLTLLLLLYFPGRHLYMRRQSPHS